jgi:hypothetical protein
MVGNVVKQQVEIGLVGLHRDSAGSDTALGGRRGGDRGDEPAIVARGGDSGDCWWAADEVDHDVGARGQHRPHLCGDVAVTVDRMGHAEFAESITITRVGRPEDPEPT